MTTPDSNPPLIDAHALVRQYLANQRTEFTVAEAEAIRAFTEEQGAALGLDERLTHMFDLMLELCKVEEAASKGLLATGQLSAKQRREYESVLRQSKKQRTRWEKFWGFRLVAEKQGEAGGTDEQG